MNKLSDFLVEEILKEAKDMQPVVVYSGRFQPFHRGHYAAYQRLVSKFGSNNVFIASSNTQDDSKSPFSFKDKKDIASKMFGIPVSKFVQVKNPYAPEEVLSKFDKNKYYYVAAVGDKDASRLRGKYFTQYSNSGEKEGYLDKGYYFIIPPEQDVLSGTEVRNAFKKGTEKQQEKFFINAFGKMDKTIFNLVKKKINEDIIPGGKSEGKTLEDIARKYAGQYYDYRNVLEVVKEQMKIGIKTEMEHTNNIKIAAEIAKDHIWEDLHYYTKLQKVEEVGIGTGGVGALYKGYPGKDELRARMKKVAAYRKKTDTDKEYCYEPINEASSDGTGYDEETLNKTVENPKTKQKIKVKTALNYSDAKDPGMRAAYKAALAMVQKKGAQKPPEDVKPKAKQQEPTDKKGAEAPNPEQPTSIEKPQTAAKASDQQKAELPQNGVDQQGGGEEQKPQPNIFQPHADKADLKPYNDEPGSKIKVFKGKSSGEEIKTISFKGGGYLYGVEHRNEEMVDDIITQVKASIPQEKWGDIVFIGEGGATNDDGELEFHDEVPHAVDKFKEMGASIDTFDGDELDVHKPDSTLYQMQMKATKLSHSQIKAGNWASMIGQGEGTDTMPTKTFLDEEGKKFLNDSAREAGFKPIENWEEPSDQDKDTLYRLSFPADNDDKETAVNDIQIAFNKARDLNLIKKTKEYSSQGKIPVTIAGDGHVDLVGSGLKVTGTTIDTEPKLQDVPEDFKKQVATKINDLQKQFEDDKKNGIKREVYNLCQISVPGTNLYCDGNKNIPRDKMPQFKGKPLPNTPAASMELNKDGEVDTEPMFKKMLDEKGIKVTQEEVPVESLKATQNELVGQKVLGMEAGLEENPEHPGITAPIYVSKDGYVVDGHHRWAAITSYNLKHPDKPIPMKVMIIDDTIDNIIPMSNKFAEDIGIAAKSGSDKTKTEAYISLSDYLAKQIIDEILKEDAEGAWDGGPLDPNGPSAIDAYFEGPLNNYSTTRSDLSSYSGTANASTGKEHNSAWAEFDNQKYYTGTLPGWEVYGHLSNDIIPKDIQQKVLPIYNHGSENGEYGQTKGPYGGVKIPFTSPDKMVYERIKKLGLPLLTEGGAYGHMNHPFDIQMNLTFGDLKNIVNNALDGNLGVVREKTDGQALAISWKNGRLIAARNKTHLSNGGASALDATALSDKFSGRGALADAYNFAMKDLASAISSLSEKDRKSIFKDGSAFCNLEVIYPKNANVIPYGQNLLVFHNVVEYDKSGNAIGVVKGGETKLANMIKKVNADVQSKYTIQGPPITKLPTDEKLSSQKGKFNAMLSKLQSEFKLSDTDGVADYHFAWWMKFVNDSKKKLSQLEKEGLARRWAFDNKTFSIKSIADDDAKKWADGVDKGAKDKIMKGNLRKFEDIFLGVGAEVLSFMSSVLTAQPNKALQTIKTSLDSTISQIRSQGSAEQIKRLEKELSRLNAIGGFDKLVPNEGLVFFYNGNTYKLTGTFAPLNQILGIFKFGR